MPDPDYKALCAELVQDIEEWIVAVDHCPPSSSALITRARAALAQPEPVAPTDEEIMELMPQQMRDDLANAARALAGFDRANVKAAGAMRIILNRQAVNHARAALARWGNSQGILDSSPQPVPVAERLPGPEDCSSRGYFWAYAGDDWEETDIDGMNWQHLHHHGYTHWLPHHALPLPTSQEDYDR
jgi:hypothetical protein